MLGFLFVLIMHAFIELQFYEQASVFLLSFYSLEKFAEADSDHCAL